MSKKKTQKAELKLLASKTKMEEFSGCLFKFIKDNIEIDKAVDNNYIKIIPYCESDFGDQSQVDAIENNEVVMYEIFPKNNPDVEIFLDDREIVATYKSNSVNLSDDELAYLVSNMFEYIKTYCDLQVA